MGFSHGFRPGRSQHQALDALWGTMRKKVNWVLDADIRGFFDNMSHEWTMKFVEHRVAERRVLRLIGKMAKGGSIRGRELVEDGGGDSAKSNDFAAAGEHLPALHLRPMGRALAKASSDGRHGRCPVRR
jgi:hypothetical protein